MESEIFEKAFSKIPNRFLLNTLLAKRVHQLNNGAAPMVEADGSSFLEVALRELAEGKLRFQPGSPEKHQPQEGDMKKADSEEEP